MKITIAVNDLLFRCQSSVWISLSLSCTCIPLKSLLFWYGGLIIMVIIKAYIHIDEMNMYSGNDINLRQHNIKVSQLCFMSKII